ncbi:MAG: hypothetical protein WA709_17065 [Stellaceae bacterium]
MTKSRRIFAARSLTFLQFPQAGFEIARIDRPQKGFDHLGQREAVARGDGAAPDCAGDHFYRAQDIACVADRRQSELDRPFAARRDRAVETEPQGGLIAGKRQLDRLRVNAVASPSSNSSAARVARFEEPRGRPAGLPDCPFGNGRRRPRLAVFAVFCSEISVIAPSRPITGAIIGAFLNEMKRQHYGNFSVVAYKAMKRERHFAKSDMRASNPHPPIPEPVLGARSADP